MPGKLEHLTKAEHNESYYLSFDLNRTPYLDWVVNGIFYSALHYIEAYLAICGKHPTTHAHRNTDIEADQNLGRFIYREYRSLKDDSEDGRYLMKIFTPGEIIQDIIPRLDSIKNILKKYIPEIKMG